MWWGSKGKKRTSRGGWAVSEESGWVGLGWFSSVKGGRGRGEVSDGERSANERAEEEGARERGVGMKDGANLILNRVLDGLHVGENHLGDELIEGALSLPSEHSLSLGGVTVKELDLGGSEVPERQRREAEERSSVRASSLESRFEQSEARRAGRLTSRRS